MPEPLPPTEGLRARKKRALRRRIVETAGRLFAEKGFAETRVEEIAGALDVSTATVFNYFGSKDAILLELAEEQIARFEALLHRLDEVLQRAPEPGLGGLRHVSDAAASALADVPAINRRLYVEIMRVTLPRETGRRISRRIHAALAKLLESGQRAGEVRSDVPAERLAEHAADMLAGAFNNWLSDARRPLPERLAGAIVFLEEAMRPRD